MSQRPSSSSYTWCSSERRFVGQGPCLPQGMQKHTGESISVLSVVSRMTQTSFPWISTACKNNKMNTREIKRSSPCQQTFPQTSGIPDQRDSMQGKERLILRVYMLEDRHHSNQRQYKTVRCCTQMQDKVSHPKGVILLP